MAITKFNGISKLVFSRLVNQAITNGVSNLVCNAQLTSTVIYER